ncbi:V-set and immunoglobulin domain-containing protein 10 isoform X1 [Bufo bufo]|uniref:V-set and immunoglobulin domain-containing protein 10 isoform X1 n=1 Tax=Bufo bufo TaxID=8384 RepID=UPI001ABE049C|nr:V-set and immunoglobulin domain-containing protein 10 isoform X1 [Bufo bufo]
MGPLEELLLILCALCGGACGASVITISGEVGGQAVLPCRTTAENAGGVTWFMENPKEEVLSCNTDVPSNPRYSRRNGSSLVITDLRLEDERLYGCKDCSETADTPAQVQLKITSGPHNITFLISPTKTMPNGTHYTSSGANMNFTCSSSAIPEPTNSIGFNAGSQSELFDWVNASLLAFNLRNIAANYQGNYTCTVVNPLSKKTLLRTLQLLVYRPPDSHMECGVNNTGVPSGLSLTCTWLGGYPSPLLQWEYKGDTLSNGTSDTLVVTLNGSRYDDGQTFTCRGRHLTNEVKEATCTVQLGYPVPQSQVLRTCLKGENVTLSCSVLRANPPAVITWLRNLSQPNVEIQSGTKYHIVQIHSSMVSYLTIVNCSKEEDEGSYICVTNNGVATQDFYIWLDVTTPHNIIGLVSAILILFLIVVALIVGSILYCDPQLYIKANPFRKGASEVLILVESEEEDEMQQVDDSVVNAEYTDAATSSPATANGSICKHQVLFHNPPDDISPNLLSEVSEETDRENAEENL